jgi:hypothetical protein
MPSHLIKGCASVPSHIPQVDGFAMKASAGHLQEKKQKIENEINDSKKKKLENGRKGAEDANPCHMLKVIV